jgi:DNA-binding MarR family transcriptional regulator
MKDSIISEMRSFNRWYTAFIGVLNRKWMNGELTLPETRVLQAISMQEGITAGEIVLLLHIDKSYLSKIVLRFQRQRLLTKKASASDGRSQELYLTAAGRKVFEKHNQATNQFVRQQLEPLPAADCEELVRCMRRIREILERVE